MNKASFSIESYKFDKVMIDLSNQKTNDIFIDFKPEGVFNGNDGTFELTFNFLALDSQETIVPFVEIRCVGLFKFENVNSLEEIPSFFYKNSIAILFPFLRAFVSIVTVQANIKPIMLPTMNLGSLEEPLRENTTEILAN
ncbi:protein-export chaperone SecB [Flavobacterium sp.]|jgi:preprotein translocase subunit SecB|uniref:protein-export chaperone SecB n=1 Tax=Flavobacterium sp. TaxID=239 RepID=UPI0022C35867|nr:protein-export chaperone SecB [Flavobacterium sp.]MCZ8297729.1 protein-export chaperone SecB [Flavobacterium sp.]